MSADSQPSASSQPGANSQPGKKLVIIGQSTWTIPTGTDVPTIVNQIRQAMSSGTTIELDLADANGREVMVLLNGKAVETVAIDLDGDPKPGEMI